MKKIVALLMVLAMVFAFAACGDTADTSSETASTATSSTESTETSKDEIKVMTHEEYMAAELQSEVVVETYVQGHQSWWDNKITVYCQSKDGAYLA